MRGNQERYGSIANGRISKQRNSQPVILLGYVHQKSVNAVQIISVFTFVWDDAHKEHKREKSMTGITARSVFLVVLVPFHIQRGSMTKQLRATMAAILVISSISLPAQTSTANKPTTRKPATKKAPVET